MSGYGFKPMEGLRFGKLTVVERRGGKTALWLCRCDCGTEKIILGTVLRSGKSKSCGCSRYDKRPPRYEDISGQTFSYLRAKAWARNSHYGSEWLCECVCGKERIVRASYLRNGSVRSCGCKTREAIGNRMRRHGMSRSPTWNSWASMRKRCQDKKCSAFWRYGGRGIRVCERWNVFENFLADMGERPTRRHSIERINNNGNYELNNCVWALPIQQANNRSSSLLLSLNGKTQTLTQWASELGIVENTLRGRLRLGWSVEDALTTIVVPRGRAA